MTSRLSVQAMDDEELHGPPTAVDLPVGRAVRLRARARAVIAASSGEEPPVDAVRYYVPLPHWDRLLVLAFSTPSLSAADAFSELFDLLALTARWKAAP
jgi:hypothetical protein